MATSDDALWTGMTKLLQGFIQRPDTEPFRTPVDWKALGLYDYPQIIKQPMDLGTVKKKIGSRQYSSIHEAAEDIRLVWTNCMTYNADGSDFFMLAKTLGKKWDEKYNKFLAEHSVERGPAGAPTNDKVSLEDKRAFAKSLYKLSKEDLGKLIVEVDSKCPQALTKNSTEDECELNVDKLTPTLFGELRAFVATCSSASTAASKKKKKT